MKQRGIWLTLSNGQCATGLTYAVFRSKVLPKLKTKDIPRKKETAVLKHKQNAQIVEQTKDQDRFPVIAFYEKPEKEIDAHGCQKQENIGDMRPDTVGVKCQAGHQQAYVSVARRGEIINNQKNREKKEQKLLLINMLDLKTIFQIGKMKCLNII